MESKVTRIDSAAIRAYFEKVRQLARTGEQYPVNLDEVWPLVYAQKDKAVRALRKDFFEQDDFTLLSQYGEQKRRGGHNEQSYGLTIACLEYFIVRKVRDVFEVYRQVFHAVAEELENPSLPPTEMELLLQTLQANVAIAQKMVDTERRVATLEQKIERIEQIQDQAKTELLALPAPTETMPELAKEDRIKQFVNTYSRANNTYQRDVWHIIYNELYYRYHISVNSYKLNPGESKLQMLKRVGHLDKLYVIASNVLQVTTTARRPD